MDRETLLLVVALVAIGLLPGHPRRGFLVGFLLRLSGFVRGCYVRLGWWLEDRAGCKGCGRTQKKQGHEPRTDPRVLWWCRDCKRWWPLLRPDGRAQFHDVTR